MRKLSIIILIMATLVPSLLIAAGSSEKKCTTKYPVVMVHGIALHDQNLASIDYWWKIPGAIEDEGADVYVSNQQAFNAHSVRGQEVFEYLLYLQAIHPEYTKFNLIAHSQGGLDSRYLISNCAMNGKSGKDIVASLTTISTPHRGTIVADTVLGLLGSTSFSVISEITNIITKFFYPIDTNPNAAAAFYQLTRPYMNDIFNPNTPDMEGIYYQSYAGKIKLLTSDGIVTGPLWAFMKTAGEGDNDGMVPVNSAKWGDWRGEINGAWWSGGVSHFNEIGHIFGVTPGFDAPQFYVDVVEDLKNRGL